MPADLNRLTEGWLELESDPGLFTLLLEDFGVRGVQVEEVYDLQKSIEGPVYGFIFLFKWIEERRSRRKMTGEESYVEDEDTINSIFFAQQMVPNSCATHALLSVLLNCPKIYLGPTLLRLKEHTANMSPENKGYAIGNTPELARAHNSHAKPEPRHLHEKSHGITTGRTVETFHFVSYVPISGRLFELDGLKPFPIDHGPCSEEDWTEKFRRVMKERLGTATGGEQYHDVRFSLMAVVPDRRIAYEQKLRTLKTNRQIVLEALQQLVKLTNPELTSDDQAAYIAAVNKSPKETAEEENSKQTSQEEKASSPKPNEGEEEEDESSTYPKLPPALDSHNYAKSPLMEGLKPDQSGSVPHYEECSGSEYSEDDSGPSGGTKTESDKKAIGSSKEQRDSAPGAAADKGTNQCKDTKESSDQNSMEPLTINTSSDFMKPLSIQTKFQTSPTPSASSTDTSSEVGSAFNSPVQAPYNFPLTSPNSTAPAKSEGASVEEMRDIKKFVVIRMTSGKDDDVDACRANSKSSNEQKGSVDKKSKSEEPPVKKALVETMPSTSGSGKSPHRSTNASGKSKQQQQQQQAKVIEEEEDEKKKAESSDYPQLTEPHHFAPKDLLALLKTVETEIAICESNLHDEIEKRKKYKLDDCRRTHNYDQFICTFLSMLAEQGKLADLVEQQLIVHKRQGVNVGRINRAKKPERRRRPRPKKRK